MLNSKKKDICKTWNVPDWQDASAYPKPGDLSNTLWRWEFLRRLKEYRKDWQTHSQGTYKHLLARPKHKRKLLIPDHPQFRATGDYLLAKVKPGTAQEREALRVIRSLRKYRLIRGLPNPAIREPLMLSFHPSFGGMFVGRGEVEEVMIEKFHVLYGFDLTQPIPPQIETAKEHLLHEQQWRKEKRIDRRLHRSLLPRYLRVLDARDSGASFREIGKILLGIDDYDEAAKRAKDLHDQALFLQSNLSLYF